MLLDELQKDVNSSLKKSDRTRVDTLRFLISAVRNHAIAKYGNAWETSVCDRDVLEVIQKQVKTHKESISAFDGAGRMELSEKEKKELDILSSFLPKELSDDELKSLLSEVVASGDVSTVPAGRQDFGLLMKAAMAKVKGQADGGRVASLLKQMHQNK